MFFYQISEYNIWISPLISIYKSSTDMLQVLQRSYKSLSKRKR